MTITIEDVLVAVAEAQQEMQADPDLVPRLYLTHQMSITGIAKHTGLHRATIYRRLEKAGVYEGPGKPGPQAQTHCQRNHDLAVWGRPMPKGGRRCIKCKQERERKTS